jgi:hypothetical protein
MSEQHLAEAFVEMADTLVDDFDLIDFLHVLTDRCVRLLNVSAAGLLLTDQRGALRLVAASTEQTGCWNCSNSKPTRARAWNASAPADPSRSST